MIDIIEQLQDKDDKVAYELSKMIGAKSAQSDEYYPLFDQFKELMSSSSSYIRTRGFILCCAQARWDSQGKIKESLGDMLKLVHDDKPTVVRQCLKALSEVALFLPELSVDIRKELDTIDLSRYKDSMSPLIKKDIEELYRSLE